MTTKAAEAAEPSRRRAKREPFPTTPDSVEIALTAAASGKPLPDVARRLLEEQTKLIHAQWTELRLRHVGEGVRAALWAVLALGALAILSLVLAILVQAARTDALVVQSFRVPASLNVRGVSGEVLATQILDKLAEMQAETESIRAPSTYANSWDDELKIDIPNTGASSDQVWKLLRRWLGKETRISGEVIEVDGKLALTTRVGSSPGQRFVSPTGNLDELVSQASELIYRHTQPYRFAMFVSRSPGRESERYDVLKRLTKDASPVERKWAYSGLTFDRNSAGDFHAALAMGKSALAIDPQMVPALANVAKAHLNLGQKQAGLDLWNYAKSRPKSSEYDPVIEAANACATDTEIGLAANDPVLIDSAATCLETAPSSYAEGITYVRLVAAMLRNDPEPLLRYREPQAPGVPAAIVERANADFQFIGEMIRGPSPRLAAALDAFTRNAELPPSVGSAAAYVRALAPVDDWPRQAHAMSMLGRHAEAAALIARTPRDCYDCVRVRGVVAQAQGDAVGAQRWFAEAVRQGPRLSSAYLDWARLLARQGRIPGAEARFAKAAKLAPNWPDPLKYWGDALVDQGKREEAIAKYDAALKLAPNWIELRQARSRLQPST